MLVEAQKPLVRARHEQEVRRERVRVHEQLLERKKKVEATKSALMAAERVFADLPIRHRPSNLSLIGAYIPDASEAQSRSTAFGGPGSNPHITDTLDEASEVAKYRAIFQSQLESIEQQAEARCAECHAFEFCLHAIAFGRTVVCDIEDTSTLCCTPLL